ncbi:MAG TPA: VWA domain-containing protein [Chthoniobacterales bacterium]
MLGLVLALHLLFGGLAAVWVVARYSAGRQLTFRAGPPSPNDAERALEHRVQVRKRSAIARPPAAAPQRVLTTAATKFTLPPLPEIESPKILPAAPQMLAAPAAFNLAANGRTNGRAFAGSGAAINFFGIRDVSQSVVIMIDVSDSMFTRTGDAVGGKLIRHGSEQSFQLVRDEAVRLVNSLTSATRFDIIRWAGSARAWRPALVLATDENKTAAIAQIENEIDYKSAKPKGRPGGTRHDYALELAFSLRPQTIYMLTDGNATEAIPHHGLKEIPANELYKIAETGQKTLPQRARLHTIYYLDAADKKEEREMLRQLAARNGGQFQTVEAKDRKIRKKDVR